MPCSPPPVVKPHESPRVLSGLPLPSIQIFSPAYRFSTRPDDATWAELSSTTHYDTQTGRIEFQHRAMASFISGCFMHRFLHNEGINFPDNSVEINHLNAFQVIRAFSLPAGGTG